MIVSSELVDLCRRDHFTNHLFEVSFHFWQIPVLNIKVGLKGVFIARTCFPGGDLRCNCLISDIRVIS